MTTFTHQYDEASPKVTIELDKDANYTELLEAFIGFSHTLTFSGSIIEGSIKALAREYEEGEIDPFDGEYPYKVPAPEPVTDDSLPTAKKTYCYFCGMNTSVCADGSCFTCGKVLTC